MRAAVASLALTDFRSYERAELALGGRSVFLFGPNGAGKTNLLEAISLFSPGRGMRAASLAELGRRLPDEAQGRAWAVSTAIEGEGRCRSARRCKPSRDGRETPPNFDESPAPPLSPSSRFAP